MLPRIATGGRLGLFVNLADILKRLFDEAVRLLYIGNADDLARLAVAEDAHADASLLRLAPFARPKRRGLFRSSIIRRGRHRQDQSAAHARRVSRESLRMGQGFRRLRRST